MSLDDATLAPEKPRRFLGCGCSAWLLLGLVVFLIATTGVGMGSIETGWYLVAGWVSFLYRTLPRIAWNWDLIGMGLVCVVVILFLTHRFLHGVMLSITSKREATFRWPWRWTWCAVASLGVLFLVGMAVGGAAHQIGWISSSPEPMMTRRPAKEFFDMHRLERGLKVALTEAEVADSTGMRRQLWDVRKQLIASPAQTPAILQAHHVLLIAPTNTVEGWIIFPRNPAQLERFGGRMQQGEEFKQLKAAEVHEEVERLRGILVSL